MKKSLFYLLIVWAFVNLNFSFVFGKEIKFLIYSTQILGNSFQKDILNFYLENLRKSIIEEGISFETKFFSPTEARALLKAGAYEAIAELKTINIDDKISLEWKLILPERENPYYFSVYGDKDKIDQLVKETVNILKSLLEKKELVEKIRIKGNLRIGEDLILSHISTKPGDILDYKKLDQDLRSIYKMGYFENIEIKIDKGTKGAIVTFEVKENPSVKEVVFKGNKEVKTEDLKKIVNIEEGKIVTSKDLDKALENIKAYYEQLGYSGTKVVITSEKVSSAQIRLIFNIKEGKKKYIKRIEFVGNKAFSDKELKSLLSISEKSIFSPVKKIAKYLRTIVNPEPIAEPGVYNVAFLYRDLGKIETFYKNHGYIDVKIGDPIIKEEPDGVIIKIPIDEGPQYKVGEIKIEQDLFPEDKLYNKIRTSSGKVFSLKTLLEDKNILNHLFADYGYAYVKIDTDIQKDVEHKLVNVTFKIDKGPVVYINRIEIEGNTKTRDKVIRRQIRLAEGWPYSASRLEDSEIRLRRLGFFKDLKIEKEKGAKENELNLKVKVKEMLTGTFGIGGGYSSYDKFIIMFDITERNFLGKGQRVNLSGRLGTRSSRYSINFYDPYFRDTRYSLGWSLYNFELEYDDFTKDTKGGSIRIGYDFTSLLSGYIGFRYDDTKLKDLSDNVAEIILKSKDINITTAFQSGIAYDSRNRYFMPTKGWYHRLDLEYAGKVLGGESNYLKIEGEHSVYMPIYKKLIGHIRLGYGYLTEGGAHKIPVFERFYLGGINSVRGYQYGDISPKDPVTDDKIGGTRKFFVQTEAIFPLIGSINLNGVIFFDMGNVWDKKTGFKSADLRKSIGIGLRWLSPFGPLRIEWGYNIDKKPGDDSSNFNFQIGGQF